MKSLLSFLLMASLSSPFFAQGEHFEKSPSIFESKELFLEAGGNQNWFSKNVLKSDEKAAQRLIEALNNPRVVYAVPGVLDGTMEIFTATGHHLLSLSDLQCSVVNTMIDVLPQRLIIREIDLRLLRGVSISSIRASLLNYAIILDLLDKHSGCDLSASGYQVVVDKIVEFILTNDDPQTSVTIQNYLQAPEHEIEKKRSYRQAGERLRKDVVEELNLVDFDY